VLRYEKRTKTYAQEIAASEDFAAFSVEEETIQDAISAGKLLASDSRLIRCASLSWGTAWAPCLRRGL
jgi:hypothetical protein